eukprot:3792054-Rhodomonas_salina.2
MKWLADTRRRKIKMHGETEERATDPVISAALSSKDFSTRFSATAGEGGSASCRRIELRLGKQSPSWSSCDDTYISRWTQRHHRDTI